MTELEKRVTHGIRINEELMEQLHSTIRWVLHYCDKNNITPPNLQILSDSIDRIQDYLNRLPNFDQPTKNTTNNNRFGHRTIKQYSYKVQVPYHTVW